MKDKKPVGIIYSVENEITGEFYIGATTYSIEDRKADHIRRADKESKSYFHESIATYGTEAFIWNEIDTANSIDELAQKEKKYIESYNSKEDGYNCDSGGGFMKTVYQYDIDSKELIESYDCLQSASNAINATKQHISRACLSVNQKYGGYYWSYKYPFTPNKDVRKRKVLFYDLDKDIIQEFESVAEASRKTGVSKSCIARFCRGERKPPNAFEWLYI